MNIFFLDHEPSKIPKMLADEHVNKMTLESAQLLCNLFPEGEAPYKYYGVNHPCTKWLREDINNIKWLLEHAFALENEYRNRFHKKHKSYDVLRWVEDHLPMLEGFIPEEHLTIPPMVVPDAYKAPQKDVEEHWNHKVENTTDMAFGKVSFHFAPIVRAYRRYYANEKATKLSYARGKKPAWLKRVP